jgi:cytidyltransferase-like protein
MQTVFVSGCYDILHAGHIQFFSEARALGDRLVVSFASDDVLHAHKERASSLPEDHKKALIESLRMVDEVVIGRGLEIGLDFKDDFLRIKPAILAVTEDDKYAAAKRALCDEVGARYVVLPKTPPRFKPVSTSSIVRHIRAPQVAPLRVDFAGGWLDVPRLARPGAHIVNCAISPLVSLDNWPYEKMSGLGGSGAWALLNGYDGVTSELDLGVGWQDPAVIRETGLCVWRSGQRPELALKTDGAMLAGRLALLWTGGEHSTPGNVNKSRDYELIARAGEQAARAVHAGNLALLADAAALSYQAQLAEGMSPLSEIPGALARKYCGGGWGGYALVIFREPAARDAFVAATPRAKSVEPHISL